MASTRSETGVLGIPPQHKADESEETTPEPEESPPPAIEDDSEGTTQRRGWRTWLADLAPLAIYVALAVYVMNRLWADPRGSALSHNPDDHGVQMWFTAHAERFLWHGESPFWTVRLNAPDGVNQMANTSFLGLSVPVAPITHFFGAEVSTVLLLTLGLAGTAAATYWVLLRHWVRSRPAAFVGGLWCGFAPAMISHANGHINFVANFVVPFIVVQALRLRDKERWLRHSLILAALVVAQVFINEEVLLFTALGLVVYAVAYAVNSPRRAWAAVWPMARGLTVAAVVALALLAYPLWFQFFGPGHYRGLPYEPSEYVTDLASYAAFARQSIGGDTATAELLSNSPTEDNAFFGWPVLVMLGLSMVLLVRSAATRATVLTGLVFGVISLGPSLMLNGEETGRRLPFSFIQDVPVVDLVSVTRFAMVVTFVAGIVLALATDKAVAGATTKSGSTGRWALRLGLAGVWLVALAAALAPVAPRPLPVTAAAPPPPFVTSGEWQQYVPDGRTMVTVPLPGVTAGRTGMRWSAMTGLDIRMPRGYFMGPLDPPDDLTGAWMPAARPTSTFFQSVWFNGKVPRITPELRQHARDDLRHWQASVVVLDDAERNHDQLEAAVTSLLGFEPTATGGVLLWDLDKLAPDGP